MEIDYEQLEYEEMNEWYILYENGHVFYNFERVYENKDGFCIMYKYEYVGGIKKEVAIPMRPEWLLRKYFPDKQEVEVKGIMSDTSKSVIQLDVEENELNRYKSITEASRVTWIACSSISRVCKWYRKIAGWYLWKIVT